MKRTGIFIFTLFALLSSSSFSQFRSIGFRFGYIRSNVFPITAKGKGIDGGLFTEYTVHKNWLMRAEIFYTLEQASFESILQNETFTQKYNYIIIPLLVQYELPVSFTVKPKIFLGPEFSFLQHSKMGLDLHNGIVYETENKKDIKTTGFEIVIGAGGSYDWEHVKIDFDIRYKRGLNDMNKSPNDIATKMEAVSFNLGVGFTL
jgi:hypothetical protein